MRIKSILLMLLLIVIIPTGLILAEKGSTAKSMVGEMVKWEVISQGGTAGASASYRLEGSIGQAADAVGSSTSTRIVHGYWQNFVSGDCCLHAGDADHDGLVDLRDITFLIKSLYKGGAAPICLGEANADGIDPINLKDITYVIRFCYKGGPAPVCP